MIKFTSSEVRDLIIAFFVISLCFAIANSGRDVNAILNILPIVMVGVGAGFILHELGHKLLGRIQVMASRTDICTYHILFRFRICSTRCSIYLCQLHD